MKRFLCLIIAMLCLAAPACASETDTSADYNTAGKLLKQLWAGSGFSGTLTVEVTPNEARAGQAITTQKPLVFNVDYIYTRPTDTAAAAHRLDLSLMENEAAQASAHLSYQDGVAALQSDLIGSDWYAFTSGDSVRASTDDAGQGSGALSGVKDGINGFLGQTDMPALLTYMLPMALKMQEQTDALADVISTYITRIDLWIAGYRQNATLGKAEDGNTTMTVKYVIPPAAIKSQAEQMVLDLLSDPTTLSKLQALLSAGDAELLLNPQLQKYYFQAIESLPLPADMTIERTVSLKGDTLALHVLLPMYDAEGGAFTVEYDRVKGESDLPDQNVITMAGTQRTNTLHYQTYSSMDGVTVYQGSFVSESAGTAGFAVGESDTAADAPQKTLAVAFTLTSKGAEGRDDQDRDIYDYSLSLALAPDTTQGTQGEIADFEATTLALDAHFASKTLKTAATEIDATFTVSGDERANGVKAQLVGKTRKKWEPTALPEKLVDVSAMTEGDFAALLPGVTTRGGALLLSYLSLPTVDATPETTEAPAAGTPTPEVFETLAPGETIAPTETAES